MDVKDQQPGRFGLKHRQRIFPIFRDDHILAESIQQTVQLQSRRDSPPGVRATI